MNYYVPTVNVMRNLCVLHTNTVKIFQWFKFHGCACETSGLVASRNSCMHDQAYDTPVLSCRKWQLLALSAAGGVTNACTFGVWMEARLFQWWCSEADGTCPFGRCQAESTCRKARCASDIPFCNKKISIIRPKSSYFWPLFSAAVCENSAV